MFRNCTEANRSAIERRGMQCRNGRLADRDQMKFVRTIGCRLVLGQEPCPGRHVVGAHPDIRTAEQIGQEDLLYVAAEPTAPVVGFVVTGFRLADAAQFRGQHDLALLHDGLERAARRGVGSHALTVQIEAGLPVRLRGDESQAGQLQPRFRSED